MSEELSKQTKIFITLGALAIAAFILFAGYMIMKPEVIEKETLEYNYFTFEEEQGMWKTTIQKGEQPYELVLRFNPYEVENITYEGNLTPEWFMNPPIYITFDPDTEPEQMKYLALAASEVGLSLVRGIGVNISAACTKNITEDCMNQTIVACNDTDKSVIYLKIGEPNRLFIENNCVTLQGKDFGILKSVDRLLYEWYGIIRTDLEQ